MKDYTKTYYYDYHMLKKSLEASKIMLDAYQLELDELLHNDKNNLERIQVVRKRMSAREKIINKQNDLLDSMGKAITTFPGCLKKRENEVFELDVIQNKSSDEIAYELCVTPQYVRIIKSRIINKFRDYEKIVKSNTRP